jgi:hypothetical protein
MHAAKYDAKTEKFIHVKIIRISRGREACITILDIDHIRMPVG